MRTVQTQSAGLNKLDLEYGKSREYLAKVVKLRDDWPGGGNVGGTAAAEEFLLGASGAHAGMGQEGGGGGGNIWVEETMFGS